MRIIPFENQYRDDMIFMVFKSCANHSPSILLKSFHEVSAPHSHP